MGVVASRDNRNEGVLHASADKAFGVDSTKLERGEVWGETDSAVHWKGAFAVYGGHGTTASSVIVYEIEPGKRLGWHTDATEETQYIIAGTGKLYIEDARNLDRTSQRVRAADADAPRRREYRQGNAARRRTFFAAAMFTQDFDQVMMPPKTHILGTPNREG